MYCVAKCKANRPTWLFKDLLHKVLSLQKKLGACAMVKGMFCFPDRNIPFVAVSIILEMTGKSPTIGNFISSAHSNSINEVLDVDEVVTSGKDGNEVSTKKAIFAEGSIVSTYNNESGHIDAINSQLIESLPLGRNCRWKVCNFVV